MIVLLSSLSPGEDSMRKISRKVLKFASRIRTRKLFEGVSSSNKAVGRRFLYFLEMLNYVPSNPSADMLASMVAPA